MSLAGWSIGTLLICVSCELTRVNFGVDRDRVVATVRPELVSFTLDWHNTSVEDWEGMSVLALDLQDIRLRTYVRHLSPAFLRIGGSDGDNAVYDIPGETQPSHGCPGMFCISFARWKEILKFCDDLGCKVVFGLNALYGRGIDRKHVNRRKHWDASNTEALLRQTSKLKDLRHVVWGWELGNELEHTISAKGLGSQYLKLKMMIDTYWNDVPEDQRPRIIGPDMNPSLKFVPQFTSVAKGALQIFSYHQYTGDGADKHLREKILTSEFLDIAAQTADAMSKAASGLDLELWIGETAAAWRSGQDQVTNTFASSFWYLNQLGSLSLLNFKVQLRQILIGGHYELIDKRTMKANPDFYLALLWKKLMGDIVLAVNFSKPASDSLRIYSHCAPTKGVSFGIINFSNSSEVFELIPAFNAPSPRVEYHLTSGEKTVFSQHVQLNGWPLDLNDHGTVDLLGRLVRDPSEHIRISPESIVFLHFPEENAPACVGAVSMQ